MDSVNHTLSAEAAVFVPRQIPDPASVPLNQIPSYMTNCYPFVQGEYDRTRTTWNRHPRPPRQSFQDSSKYPRNFSGFHGNRMPAPQNFCGYTSVTPLPDNQWSPTPPVPPTDKQWSPMPSVTSMIHNLLQQPAEEIPSNLIRGEALISQNMNKTNRKKRNKDMMAWDLNGNHGKKKSGDIENCNVANTSYQEFINKDKHGFLGNRFSQGFNDNNNHGRLVSENEPVIKCYNGSSKPEINFGRKDLSSETMKNLKKNPDDRVKRGQRKKSGKSAGTGSENISKNGIATVAKKETSCQTDFPHSLSDLSLTQYPCDLYKGAVALYASGSRKECESSDADMDSDSGYNSPLHKKTQVSYGSDTAAQQNSDLFAPDNTQGQQVGTSHSHSKIPTINDPLAVFDKVVDSSHQVSPPKMSYASIAQKKPSLSVYEVGNQSATGKKNNIPSTQPLEANGELRIVKTNERMEPRRAKRTGGGANREDNGSAKENERQGNENSPNENKDVANGNTEGKKKRRRNRKRRRKKKSEPDDEAESDIEGETTHLKQVELHFEDEDEFPDLSSNALSGRVDVTPLQDKVPLSYSAMLKQKATPVPVCHSQSSDSQHRTEFEAVQEVAASKDPSSETRGIRRRRKRHEMVEKAAEEELAEINFEQQMLRELNLQQKQKTDTKDSVVQQPGILKVNPKPATAGKKSKQGISLDLSAMIIALEKKVPETAKKVPETAKKVPVATAVKKKADVKNKESQKPASKHNLLDASAPIKRGKERENPKPKKPSSLKKVILKEREEKKKMRLLDDAETANNGVSLGIGMVSGIESDLSQDALSSKSSVDYGCLGTPASNDLSPISQTSPISMSPLSSGVSPHSSEVNSPIAGTIEKEVRMKIHSRRFREYCNQVLNKDIDNCCTTLLQDLVRFQDRMYHKDPLKAKSKRRLVLGLREVTKHLKLKKIKSVIISPNLEKIQSKGGLDDALNNILNLCNEQNVPFVFALGRRALGRACAKLVPVSVVGIFNYDGSDDNFRQLMDLTEEARQSYKEMVSVIEKEIQDYPRLGAAAAVPHIYAHMGHSRTPSGASVLSFTSSILSEPISENYPHSEPETDSKGYEIVKENNKNGNATSHLKAGLKNSSISEVLKSQMKIIYPHGNVDIDDGNEADTEECNERSRSVGGRCHGIDENEESEGSDNLSQPESDTIKALPHIDSIHSSTYDLNAEILSQHSGKNVDNCDTISTHSSRTLGDGSSTILADPGDRSKHDTPKSTGSPSSTLQRGKVIDAERIQNWVNQTKSRLEDLQYLQENTEDSSGTDSNTEDEEVVDELSQSNNNGGETKNRKEGITTQNMEKGNHGNQQIDTNKTVATESGNSTSVKVCENVGNSSQPPSVESSTSVLPENKNYNLTKDSHCKDDSTAGENKVISDKKTETEVARDVDSSNNQENESATNSVKTKSCDQVLPAINSDTAVVEGCNSKQKSDTTGTEGCNSNKNCVKETPTDS